MGVIKFYGTDLAGKQAKWKDDRVSRYTADYYSRVSLFEYNLKSLFTDESGDGGLTVQQKLDALGTDAASALAAGNAVKNLLLALNPSYVAPSPATYGYSVAVNQDGTVTASAI